MAEFTYDNDEFIAISVIAWVWMAIAAVVLLLNIIRHLMTKYALSRKQGLVTILWLELSVVGLLFLSLWIYAYAEPLLIIIDIILGLIIIFYYQNIKETLTMFLWKYMNENPHNVRHIIQNDKNRIYMLERDYPMNDLILCKRTEVLDYYTAYWYLIEGSGRVWWWWNKQFDNFDRAYEFQRNNTVIIGLYLFTMPTVNIIEYIVEKADTMKVGDFSFTVLTRLYILVITVVSIMYMQSFSDSFKKIIPFIDFKNQLATICLWQFFSSLVGGILRTSQAEVGPYDEFDTYQILYIWVFSGLFCIMIIIQFFLLNPTNLKLSEDNKLLIPLEFVKIVGPDWDKKLNIPILQTHEKGSFNFCTIYKLIWFL